MVSIIIPTYKRAQYIERAINSILNQTYQDIEIIVVDDNNPDTEDRKKLEEIMRKYISNKKVIYIQHEKNKNGATARNTGIQIAKGEYITFLDDDDFFLSKRIERLVNALEKNVDYNAVYTSCLTCKNGKIMRSADADKSGNFQREMLKQKSFFATGSNLFFRADTLRKIGGFDESFIRHQDLEVMVRYFDENKILGVNEYLVVKNQDNRINVPNIQKSVQVREYYLKTFNKQIEKYNKAEIYGEAYFQLLLLAIQSKDKKIYRELLEKLKKYVDITKKMKIKIILEKLNLVFDIKSILYFVRRLKVRRNINKEVLNEIENLYKGMNYSGKK